MKYMVVSLALNSKDDKGRLFESQFKMTRLVYTIFFKTYHQDNKVTCKSVLPKATRETEVA